MLATVGLSTASPSMICPPLLAVVFRVTRAVPALTFNTVISPAVPSDAFTEIAPSVVTTLVSVRPSYSLIVNDLPLALAPDITALTVATRVFRTVLPPVDPLAKSRLAARSSPRVRPLASTTSPAPCRRRLPVSPTSKPASGKVRVPFASRASWSPADSAVTELMLRASRFPVATIIAEAAAPGARLKAPVPMVAFPVNLMKISPLASVTAALVRLPEIVASMAFPVPADQFVISPMFVLALSDRSPAVIMVEPSLPSTRLPVVASRVTVPVPAVIA